MEFKKLTPQELQSYIERTNERLKELRSQSYGLEGRTKEHFSRMIKDNEIILEQLLQSYGPGIKKFRPTLH